MPCRHCAFSTTARQPKPTALGYRTLRCAACRRRFKERPGSPFSFTESPTDRVLLVVLGRRRDKLSRRDLAEMVRKRGFVFTQEAVHQWQESLTLLPMEWRCQQWSLYAIAQSRLTTPLNPQCPALIQ